MAKEHRCSVQISKWHRALGARHISHCAKRPGPPQNIDAKLAQVKPKPFGAYAKWDNCISQLPQNWPFMFQGIFVSHDAPFDERTVTRYVLSLILGRTSTMFHKVLTTRCERLHPSVQFQWYQIRSLNEGAKGLECTLSMRRMAWTNADWRRLTQTTQVQKAPIDARCTLRQCVQWLLLHLNMTNCEINAAK